MRKQFNNVDIYAGIKAQDGAKWIADNNIDYNWKTPEHIEVRPVYTKEDLEGMEHLDFTAGIPPFLRGPYSMMYRRMPSIAVTWLPVRKVFRWPSTCPHTAVTTPTTLAWLAMWVRPV